MEKSVSLLREGGLYSIIVSSSFLRAAYGAALRRVLKERAALVESMLSLHRQLAAANTAHDKTLIQRQIGATDKQIDRLAYELYGLTEDEVGIVEQA